MELNREMPPDLAALRAEFIFWSVLICVAVVMTTLLVVAGGDGVYVPVGILVASFVIFFLGSIVGFVIHAARAPNFDLPLVGGVCGLILAPVAVLILDVVGAVDPTLYGEKGGLYFGAVYFGAKIGMLVPAAAASFVYIAKSWPIRLIFDSTASQSLGMVVQKTDKEVSDGYGGRVHTYHVVLAVGDEDGRIVLNANVNKRIFDSMSEGESIGIRHDPSNPKVALFEGEY